MSQQPGTCPCSINGVLTIEYLWKERASLALTNVQLADAGVYTVVVTNAGGSVTSSPALLVVNVSPVPLLACRFQRDS